MCDSTTSSRSSEDSRDITGLSVVKQEPLDPFFEDNQTISAQKVLCMADGKAVPVDLSSSPMDKTAEGDGSDKKRKGPAPRTEVELCLVCGDRASGFHYNALSCEGCKGFFRRSITKNAVYKCTRGGNCEMDMYMRRKCQECRLRKCREVGMLPECLLTEEQCKSKRQRRMLKQSQQVQAEESDGGGSGQVSPPASVPQQRQAPVQQQPQQSGKLDEPAELSKEQRDMLDKIVSAGRELEVPGPEDIDKVTPWLDDQENPDINSTEALNMRFAHIAELTILTVQLVVEFSKRLPGFLDLSREDQIVLLKGSAIEVLLLRAAMRYDKQEDSIIFGNGLPYTRRKLIDGGIGDLVDPMYDFSKSMSDLELDYNEFTLLMAIVIFASDRPNVQQHKKVEEMQEVYLDLFRTYLKLNKERTQMLLLPKVLMKLTELRSLNNTHSEMLFALKIKNTEIPPLLTEIWDVE